jgi:hypothetical protein
MQPIFEACLKDSNYFSDYHNRQFFDYLSPLPHVDIGKNCTAKYDVLLRGAIHFREDGGLGLTS